MPDIAETVPGLAPEGDLESTLIREPDLIKDYLALHPPFPTIIQAAGNGPGTDFVSHKGFNGVTVGNHEEGAKRMHCLKSRGASIGLALR